MHSSAACSRQRSRPPSGDSPDFQHCSQSESKHHTRHRNNSGHIAKVTGSGTSHGINFAQRAQGARGLRIGDIAHAIRRAVTTLQGEQVPQQCRKFVIVITKVDSGDAATVLLPRASRKSVRSSLLCDFAQDELLPKSVPQSARAQKVRKLLSLSGARSIGERIQTSRPTSRFAFAKARACLTWLYRRNRPVSSPQDSEAALICSMAMCILAVRFAIVCE